MQRYEERQAAYKRMESMESERIKNYWMRQEKQVQTVENRQKKKNEIITNRSNALSVKNLNTIKKRDKLSKDEEEKSANLLKRLGEIDTRISMQTEERDAENQKKIEEDRGRSEVLALQQIRFKRAEEYNNVQKMKKLEEKDAKIEEFRNRKELIRLEKAKVSKKVQEEKDQIKQKFEKIVQSNKGINAQTIKELFPDDAEFMTEEEKAKKREKEKGGKNKGKAKSKTTDKPKETENNESKPKETEKNEDKPKQTDNNVEL